MHKIKYFFSWLMYYIGMYRIVILLDNRIPDILLIETKPDTGYPAIFYSRIWISGRISG